MKLNIDSYEWCGNDVKIHTKNEDVTLVCDDCNYPLNRIGWEEIDFIVREYFRMKRTY